MLYKLFSIRTQFNIDMFSLSYMSSPLQCPFYWACENIYVSPCGYANNLLIVYSMITWIPANSAL